MFVNRNGLCFFREPLSKTGFSNQSHIKNVSFYLTNEAANVVITLEVLQIMTFMVGPFAMSYYRGTLKLLISTNQFCL